MFMQFTGCDKPVKRSYWPENAIDWLRTCVTQLHSILQLQLSGPTVHSLYCDWSEQQLFAIQVKKTNTYNKHLIHSDDCVQI